MLDEINKIQLSKNGEQDKSISDLIISIKLINNELRHTNDNLKKVFECYDKTENEVREIKEKIIPPIYSKISSYEVWIKILSTAVLGAIGAYVASLFR